MTDEEWNEEIRILREQGLALLRCGRSEIVVATAKRMALSRRVSWPERLKELRALRKAGLL